MRFSAPMLANCLVLTGATIGASLVQAQRPAAAGKLPISPGIWIMANESCAATRYVNLFDGNRWGSVSFVTNDPREKPHGGLSDIARSRTLKSGYTEVWIQSDWASPQDRSDFQVKPEGPGRMLYRTVTPDSGRIQSNGGRDIVTVDRYKQCAFAELAPRVQRGVREFAPGLDPKSGVAASTPGALASGLRWSKHNFPDGRAAGASGAKSFAEFYLRCRGGVPVFEGMYMGRPGNFNLGLTGKTSGKAALLAFAPVRGKSMVWQARANPQVLALLRGNDPAVRVTINGAADGEISLMDAAGAIQHVAEQCPALGRVTPAVVVPAARPALQTTPAAATGSSTMPAPLAPFNIAPGHYQEVGFACNSYSGVVFYYDGKRWGTWGLTGPRPNAFTSVSKARKTRKGWMLDYAEMVVLGPGRMRLLDDNTGDTDYRWCPSSQIDPRQRVK